MADGALGMMGDMQQMLQMALNYRKENPPPTQQERQGALQSYMDAARNAGADRRSGLDAMMEGIVTSPDMLNASVAIPNMFRNLKAWQDTQRESQFKREMMAQKANLDDVNARQKFYEQEIVPLMRSAAQKQLGGTARPVKLADGTWGVWDPATQSITPVPQSQQAAIQKDFDTYYKMARQMMPEETDESKIQSFANELMSRKASLRAANPITTPGGPLPVQPANIPGGAAAQPEMLLSNTRQTLEGPDVADKSAGAGFAFDTSSWSPVQKESIRRMIADYRANPTPEKQQAIEAALASMSTPPVAASGTQLIPKSQQGRLEEQAKAAGKNIEAYEKDVVENSDRAGSMLTNLGKLAEQSQKANFGMTSGFKTQLLKFADMAGADLTPEQRASMDANQVMEKIALQLATKGAKDISSRPTQLEFQKLLEQGVPSTIMTSGAFQQVLQMFVKQAKREQGQLTDFMRFKHSDKNAQTGDFQDYWNLKNSDPRYGDLSIQDVFDTMNAKKWTFNQTINKLRERK